MKRLATIVSALSCLVLTPLAASAQLVGNGNSDNAFPFSKTSVDFASTIYQQVYAASDFSGPGFLQSVSFFLNQPGDIRAGTYQLFVSTTSVAVNALSTTNFNANRGANNVLFGSYVLGGAAPSVLMFTGSSPFQYNPAAGNLLLDFRITPSGTESGDASFNANNGDANGQFSRAHNFGTAFENWGLQTQFVFSPTAVTTTPEPASFVLFGAGLVAVAAVRRRRRNQV